MVKSDDPRKESTVFFQMRLDRPTHEHVKTIAKREVRSLNAQIEYFVLRGIDEYEAGITSRSPGE